MIVCCKIFMTLVQKMNINQLLFLTFIRDLKGTKIFGYKNQFI